MMDVMILLTAFIWIFGVGIAILAILLYLCSILWGEDEL